jgi:hypothetical protein
VAISIICASFGCTPDVALEQDPKWVYAIMDYRLAQSAKELQNSKQATDMSEGQAQMLNDLAGMLRDD